MRRKMVGIKRIILPNTGIYQRKVRQVELKSDDPESLEDVKSLLEERASSLRLDDPLFLSQLEAEAADFLKEYAASDTASFGVAVGRDSTSDELEFLVSGQIGRVRQTLNLEFSKHISEEKKRKLIRRLIRVERANDACEMLHLLSVIQSQLEYGSNQVIYGRVEQVFSHGFALGRAYERFKIRESEPKAWTGDKILRATSKGGVGRKKSPEHYQKIASEYSASGLSQAAFARTARISLSTLQRAIEKQVSHQSK